MVSRLLKRRADPHVRDKDGATLLHYAVLVAAIQTLKLLIKHDVDVNLADNEGWTPLHLAAQSLTWTAEVRSLYMKALMHRSR